MQTSDEDLLKGCVLAALYKADELECTSLSMPAISSGMFGFPLELCAKIMTSCADEFSQSAKALKRYVFQCSAAHFDWGIRLPLDLCATSVNMRAVDVSNPTKCLEEMCNEMVHVQFCSCCSRLSSGCEY